MTHFLFSHQHALRNLVFYASVSRFSGFRLGQRESGLGLVNPVFNNDKGLTRFGCESCMYTRSPASSNPPDPLVVQPDLAERFSQLAKSDMSGETASYAPNLGVMFARVSCERVQSESIRIERCNSCLGSIRVE